MEKHIMEKLMIIGPLPPPIHGESLAVLNVIESKKVNEIYEVYSVNTNRINVTAAGQFSISKILKDLNIIMKVIMKAFIMKKEIVYISISQTRLGLIRDLIIIFICSIRSKKIIAHLHGNNLGNVINEMNRLEKILVEKVFNRITSGIVLGNNLKDNFKSLVQNTDVVANGIDIDYIKEEEIAHKQRDRDYISIVYLSNLIETKGYQELIYAVISLLEKGIKIKLKLAGSVFDQVKFKEVWKKVQHYNLESNIQYLGTVEGEHKKRLLLDSDIMVLPTNYPIEGQPLSIIEGMAAGLPIISTSRGSIPDLITNNGILIDSGEKKLIEQALIELINNPEEMKSMAQNSRENFSRKFTLDKYINNILDIISRPQQKG
jgi:glycosyltransferase involved in cell wall biosynthesis